MTDTYPLLKNRAFINGQWCDANNGATFDVTDPASQTVINQVPDMGADDTERAIQVAAAAWPAWRSLPARQRSTILRNWFDLLIRHQDELAQLIMREQGKPLREALAEVIYGASFIEWFAEEAKRIYGDLIPSPSATRRLMALRQSVGVVAAITPWNFPLAMITRKCAPALAAGCPIIIKPAEQTPLTALALAELAAQAGFPAGTFNVITAASGEEVGQTLTSSPLVRKLSFTGSTEVGKLLLKQCANTVKKVSMELGGNAPFIVFNDADLNLAIKGAMASKYRNSGQTCISANRFIVQNDIYDAFVERLTTEVEALTVGPGYQADSMQGPLIDQAAVEKVEEHIADATRRGAKILCGGEKHSLGGNYFEPTLLSEVSIEANIFHEETFGPVAPVFRFTDECEAVELANNTTSGLAAYCYTSNHSRIWRLTEALEYGMVGINESMISTEVAPFGGLKESGLGREGSKYGIDEYVEIKYVCVGGLDA